MLTLAGMGGMDEMGVFYDHCLESLYPPGMCVSEASGSSSPGSSSFVHIFACCVVQGTFCNHHTYDCFLADIRAACCDEDGLNCRDGQDIPITCPVGCAIVFPQFLETCRAHVQEQALQVSALQEAEYEEFEALCLSQDVRARTALMRSVWVWGVSKSHGRAFRALLSSNTRCSCSCKDACWTSPA